MTIRGWGRLFSAAVLLGLLAQVAVPAHAEEYTGDDPPGRAARLTALSGNVGIRSAGENDWQTAEENRPLTTGDALDLPTGSRAEIDFGGAQVRLDGDTQAYVDRLDDNVARVDVRSGTASLDIDDVGAGSAYELRTQTIAFAPSGRGTFRVDVDRNGVTTLTLFEGEGTVYGNNGAHYDVHSNQAYRFDDPDLRNVVGLPRPERDGFDRWVAEREGRYDEGITRQYVSEGMAGTADLDRYGRWDSAAEYSSPIWYPTIVVQDWAPYRYGRWRFVRPWGWTWIDDAPWGYAPFHYGRWVYLRNRWGWIPGPRYVRPVYSPALVGFVGGPSLFISIHSGPPVGWFPLGPRDVYCPPYRYSRNYFTRVNVTNVTINRTVINNTYEDVHVRGRGNQVNYTYRNDNHATTVASRDDFENGRRLGNNNRLRVSNDQLAHANLTTDLSPPRGRGNDNRRDDDRPARDNGPARDESDDRNGRNDRAGFGTSPGRDDRPDRGNAPVDTRGRDDDRGNGSGNAGGNVSRDREENRGGGSRDEPSVRYGTGNGNRGNGHDVDVRDDAHFTRPMSPSDDRPPPSPGNAPRRPSGNDGRPEVDRRMWSTPESDAGARYQPPQSNASRSYRSEPVPRPSGSSSGYGAPPRSVPSQPYSPPPSMNRGGDRSSQSGRGSQGPTRTDDGGGRGNAGSNDRQSRGQGNGRNPRSQN